MKRRRASKAKSYIRIPTPAGGCCFGHPCDGCQTCADGRCCRNDNPAYVLPTFGSWPFAAYGPLSELEADADGVRCHVCGEWFRSLNGHLKKHDVTSSEYKAYFGIKRGRPLERLGLAAVRSAHNLARSPDLLESFRDAARVARESMTIEQIAQRLESPSHEALLAWRREWSTGYCKNGHDITDPSNVRVRTRVRDSGVGTRTQRECRICHRASARVRSKAS